MTNETLLGHSQRGIERDLRGDARDAWRTVRAQHPRRAFTDEFHDGFLDGYADYLDRGGSAQPPAVPPIKYVRHKKYFTPEGHCLINDYYLGFKYGTDCAVASGRRQFLTVPVLLPDCTPTVAIGPSYAGPLAPVIPFIPASPPDAPPKPPTAPLPPPRPVPANDGNKFGDGPLKLPNTQLPLMPHGPGTLEGMGKPVPKLEPPVIKPFTLVLPGDTKFTPIPVPPDPDRLPIPNPPLSIPLATPLPVPDESPTLPLPALPVPNLTLPPPPDSVPLLPPNVSTPSILDELPVIPFKFVTTPVIPASALIPLK